MITTLFIAMAWKSAVILAAGLGLSWLVRCHSAAARVAVLRLTAVLVLALPLLSLLLPAWRVEAGAQPPPIVLPAHLAATAPHLAAPAVTFDGRLAVLAVYAAGVALCLLRLLGDVLTLAAWTASAESVDDPAWRSALRRTGAPTSLCLKVSPRLSAPLSWGLRPVILLNPGALDRPADADAVLAHEAGHIRRRDWLFLVLTRVAAAVFWYNPLVWWLQCELEQRSEEAVDAYAVARIDRAAYASALLGFAGAATPGAANGMARGTLKRRIALILKDTGAARAAPAVTALASLVCIAVATPLSALELIRPQAEIVTAPATEAPTIEVPATVGAPIVAGDLNAQTASPSAEAAQAEAAPATVPVAVDASRTDIQWRDTPDAIQAKQDAEQAKRDMDQARRDAEQAQRDAEQEKRDAEQAKRDQDQALRDQAQAQRDLDRQKVEQDKAQAENTRQQAKQMASEAQAQAMTQRLAAVGQMADGVDQLHKGAQELRDEAARLRDPAYRAKQIADAAARGQTVTDARLQDLIPDFEAKAVQLDEHAKELQARAAEMRGTGG